MKSSVRNFLTGLVVTFLLPLAASAAEAKPNILIFYLDDMGWAQPGCYGGKMAPTPNMDALAKSGVRFPDGYSSGCICSPGASA